MPTTTRAVIDIEEIGLGGANVPITEVADATAFAPAAAEGGSRYRAELAPGRPLEALLVNKGSDVLVVTFHGATQRSRYQLPRFEWLRTLSGMEYSSLYFSDPTLHMHELLELAWYTGWLELDLHPLLAEWARKAAGAVGASTIVFAGSSGGGFAALQVASFLPGSVAVPFSGQTSISNYFVRGRRSAQQWYVRTVMPHLAPNDLDRLGEDGDWSLPLGVRASVVRRYTERQANRVLYVQNMNDVSHVEGHYRPFRAAVESWATTDQVRFWEYDGPERHDPPKPAIFRSCIQRAVDWDAERSLRS